MKRIVVLIDGTWNKEGTAGNTKRRDAGHRPSDCRERFHQGGGDGRHRATRALS